MQEAGVDLVWARERHGRATGERTRGRRRDPVEAQMKRNF
jgi:hypothetical protein